MASWVRWNAEDVIEDLRYEYGDGPFMVCDEGSLSHFKLKTLYGISVIRNSYYSDDAYYITQQIPRDHFEPLVDFYRDKQLDTVIKNIIGRLKTLLMFFDDKERDFETLITLISKVKKEGVNMARRIVDGELMTIEDDLRF